MGKPYSVKKTMSNEREEIAETSLYRDRNPLYSSSNYFTLRICSKRYGISNLS